MTTIKVRRSDNKVVEDRHVHMHEHTPSFYLTVSSGEENTVVEAACSRIFDFRDTSITGCKEETSQRMITSD